MVKIILNEIVNTDKLQKVIECGNLPMKSTDDDNWPKIFKKILKNYYKNVADGFINVSYKQKKNRGRYYSSYGFQNLQCDVRCYLADSNYIDIDCVNCHPTILSKLIDLHLSSKPNFVNHMSEYINDRKRWLRINKTGKLDFLKMINKDTNSFSIFKNIHTQIYKKLLPIIAGENKLAYLEFKKQCKKDNKLYNVGGKFLSMYLQNIENDILMVIYNYLTDKKIKVGALIHDGLMFEKVNGENPLTEKMVEELEILIEEKTDFNIKLSFKSTDTKWEPIQRKEDDSVIIDDSEEEEEEDNSKYEVYNTEPDSVCHKILELAGDNIVWTGRNIWYKNGNSLWSCDEKNLENLLLQYGILFYYIDDTDEDEDEDEPKKVYFMNKVSCWNNYKRYLISYIKNYKLIIDNFENKLDRHPGWITFIDWAYNVKTKQKIPLKDFKYPITKTAGYFPEPPCPIATKQLDIFMMNTFNDDRELLKERFKFHARGLAGHPMDKIYSYAYGERSSGKSVEEEMFEEAFGEYVGIINADVFDKKTNLESAERKKGGLAPMCEAKIVFGSEYSGECMDGNIIKSATSGRDTQVYRQAYGKLVKKKVAASLSILLNEQVDIKPIDCLYTCLVFNYPCYYDYEPNPMKFGIFKKIDSRVDGWIYKKENRDSFVWYVLDHYGPPIYPKAEAARDELIERLRGSDPYQLFTNLLEFTENPDDKITNEDIRHLIKSFKLDIKLNQKFTKYMKNAGAIKFKKNGIVGYTNVKKKKKEQEDCYDPLENYN